MMAIYLDTSVIVARYLPTDPSFRVVENFYHESSETRYVSEISVLELYCVFSRLIQAGALTVLSDIKEFDDLSVEEKVRVAVEHAIRSWRLTVAMPDRTFLRFPVGKQAIEVGHELFDAIRISPRLALKTLDTLHLTYARAIRDLAFNLETFVTLDKEIVSKREMIQNELGITAASPVKGTDRETRARDR
jgi:predicted nucleic acid-binding protein